MFERFTEPARGVVRDAAEEARALSHRCIGTEHLLLALLAADTGIARAVLWDAGLGHDRVVEEVERLVGRGQDPLGEADAEALRAIGIDLDAVRAAIEESFGPDALQPPEPPASISWLLGRRRKPALRPTGGRVPFSARSKKVLELSLREALRLHHDYIGTEHLLLGIIREGEGVAAKILVDTGISLDELRNRVVTAIG
jgi:ATP-dependent Clp protease ATP-binding subunit ClpA